MILQLTCQFIAIYKTEKTPLDKFLDITRSILETMARYAEEIENMIDVSLHGSQDNLPEESRRTILLYHQVRPRSLEKSHIICY